MGEFGCVVYFPIFFASPERLVRLPYQTKVVQRRFKVAVVAREAGFRRRINATTARATWIMHAQLSAQLLLQPNHHANANAPV